MRKGHIKLDGGSENQWGYTKKNMCHIDRERGNINLRKGYIKLDGGSEKLVGVHKKEHVSHSRGKRAHRLEKG
ncbi:hypothetical protein AN964_22210 [Heyndrickxia shackletonii]|uniref:Uncharacterized protein n=1 Tax=Heyndrickxia shackletonii TaxID=157838 RepID=A0A0Q3T8S1_9BACI|nr:hypothetical protein AN964_22210 [Heyndrickxia shackletonii]